MGVHTWKFWLLFTIEENILWFDTSNQFKSTQEYVYKFLETQLILYHECIYIT